MAIFYKSEVVTAMREQALVPVFNHASKDVVMEIIGACVRGGSRIVEFTNRGEGAADVFGEVLKACRKDYPKTIVGAGSIRDEVTAGIYIGKGADFIVAPNFNPRVAEICNRLAVPYCPGCGTATEINNAEASGAEIIKVFPGGEVGGPAFFKAIHGPAPRTSMMPTGGVAISAESLFGWLGTGGAAAVGVGSELVTKDLIAKKDWAAVEANVRRALHAIQAVRNRILASEGVIFKGIIHVGVPTSDMNASFKMLAEIAKFDHIKPPGGTLFIRGLQGAVLETGPGEIVKEHGHLALEVTDIDKAVEILAKIGIKVDGEIRIAPDKTAKMAYLAEGAFGLKMRVHLTCIWSEEIDKLKR